MAKLKIEKRVINIIIAILLAIVSMIAALAIVIVTNIDSNYQGLFLTLGQLIATFILIFYLKLGRKELGLTYTKSNLIMHIVSILALIFIIVLVKYIVEGVQVINDFTDEVIYALLFYTVVAFTEELYFRGVIYHLLESWTPMVALVGSSIIFGFFHIRSGIGVVLIMIFTGLTFAIVRYVSNMIFLLIPFHLFFNFQSAFFSFNESTEVSAILYLVLSIIVVFSFILVKSNRETNLT